MKKITTEQLMKKLTINNVCVLDVRSEDKYAQNRIKHANVENINIPKTEIFNLNESGLKLPQSLPRDKEIIITCTTGNSAEKCATILSRNGYNVTLLEGGITSWQKQIKE